jgi:hypothetical protein
MTGPAAVLARSDFVRAPVLATARPDGYKEWHHFVVHRPGWRLLVNFSLTSEDRPGRAPDLVPRVIVVVHDRRWTGTVERFDAADLQVAADLGTLSIGGNRMSVDHTGYRVVVDLPQHDLRGELRLTPTSRPFVVNNQPVGGGRLSWLFVPRLRTDGWFQVNGQDHRLEGELAYHDHNWGRFRWGDDFGWEWGSVLPSSQDDPWSFVFMRMTDLGRLHALSQALYVWRHDEPVAMFRDAAVRVRRTGLLGRAPDCTLPPPMRLVLGGVAADVPASIEITASRSGDQVRAEFHPESVARLAQPSELHLDRSVVLSETGGSARVSGSIRGEEIDFVGAGVFELLHG